MPYFLESDDRTLLKKLRLSRVCAECGSELEALYDIDKHLPYLVCSKVHGHEGIAKDYQYRELNINTRREQMLQTQGESKTKALDKYIGQTALTRSQAQEIMEIIWPEAPIADKMAAAILCATYQLNPLASHVFLIPFKDKDTGETAWARVWGIKAKRLLASRRTGYSYLDMTPRVMTEDEQVKVWGAADQENISYLTHLKDMKTGAEVYGYGKWSKNKQPYGTDKGNTKANMASIRSESQALDRLRPAEMPSGFAVADEQYIESEGRVIDVATGEITEPPPEPEPSPAATEQETRPPAVETGSLPGIVDGKPTTKDGLFFLVAEAKAWKNTKPVLSWLTGPCHITEDRINNDPAGVWAEVSQLIGK